MRHQRIADFCDATSAEKVHCGGFSRNATAGKAEFRSGTGGDTYAGFWIADRNGDNSFWEDRLSQPDSEKAAVELCFERDERLHQPDSERAAAELYSERDERLRQPDSGRAAAELYSERDDVKRAQLRQTDPDFNARFYRAALVGRRCSLCSLGVGEKSVPKICIWETDGDGGDITCEIIDPLMLYKDPCFFDAGDVKKKQGETVFKGHRNYYLMLNLQLGIRYSVGKPSSARAKELKVSDFDPKEKFWTRFPPEGSKTTPPHHSVEFKWKDYCPVVFRHLRKLFAVHPADYMMAICGNEALRELSSPGKSGSLFYLTQDDRFIIKTVKKCEVKVLIRMLSSYYHHVCKYENSLLTKFYGVHCVKQIGCQKVRFIVIGNLFCSDYRIQRRFDLKGSSHGRTIHKAKEEIDETTTLKDLDLNFVFHIKKPWLKKLDWQIEQDCQFLVAEGIMDYSLLVGLHFRDDVYNSDVGISFPSQKICVMNEAFQGHGYLTEFCFPESGWQDTTRVDGRKPLIQLGANMPAMAEYVDNHRNGLRSGKGYHVILYFGIIDILRDYDISKKIEHAYKSLQVDPTSISAVDPKLYSRRFRDFMSRVFVEDD